MKGAGFTDAGDFLVMEKIDEPIVKEALRLVENCL